MSAESCPFDWDNFTWTYRYVSRDALHNLSYPCPNNESALMNLDSPATFFIQLLRLPLFICALLVLAALYNCVNILDRNVYSTATCSLYWMLMLFFSILKAIVLVVTIPVAATKALKDSSDANLVGFIVTTVLQSAVVFLLFIAIDHERKYRSPDYASVDSPFRRRCISIKTSKLLCSWYRVIVLILVLLPLLLLVAVETMFKLDHKDSTPRAPSPLVWTFLGALQLPRICVVIITVTIFSAKEKLKPTVPAKIYLVVGVLLTLLEDVPSSFLTVAPHSLRTCDHHGPCLLVVMTVFDLFQIIGGFSAIFFTLFVRSQFLRVEEECKLAMVLDLQRLLQVNGREDVVAH